MPSKIRKQQVGVTKLDTDLAGFGQYVDDQLGRTTNFAEAVAQWRRARDVLNTQGPQSSYRKELNKRADHFANHRGLVTGGGTRSNGRTIKRTPTGGGSRLIVTSAATRAASEKLWDASRPEVLMLDKIESPSSRPAPPLRGAIDYEVVAAYDACLIACAHARQAESTGGDIVREVIHELRAAQEWTTQIFVTTDGWQLGFGTQERFNKAVAETLAPSFGIDLADIQVVSTTRPGWKYEVVDTASVRHLYTDEDGDSDLYAE